MVLNGQSCFLCSQQRSTSSIFRFNRNVDPVLVLIVPLSLPFAASSAAELLITKASLEGLPPASAAVGGMRRFYDIAVPRDIGADVNELAGDAHVYNVDDLKEVSVMMAWLYTR